MTCIKYMKWSRCVNHDTDTLSPFSLFVHKIVKLIDFPRLNQPAKSAGELQLWGGGGVKTGTRHPRRGFTATSACDTEEPLTHRAADCRTREEAFGRGGSSVVTHRRELAWEESCATWPCISGDGRKPSGVSEWLCISLLNHLNGSVSVRVPDDVLTANAKATLAQTQWLAGTEDWLSFRWSNIIVY